MLKQSQLTEGIARQRRIFDFAPFHFARNDSVLLLVFRVDSLIESKMFKIGYLTPTIVSILTS